MTNAQRDPNHVTVLMGWDGTTTRPFLVDPTTGYLLALIDTSGTIGGVPHTSPLARDPNHVTVIGGVSSVDSATVLPLHTDSAGALLANIA